MKTSKLSILNEELNFSTTLKTDGLIIYAGALIEATLEESLN